MVNLGYLALCMIILQYALVDTSSSGSPIMCVVSLKGLGLYERLIYAGTQFQNILNTEASTRIKFCWRGWESSEYGIVHFSQVFLQGIINTFSFCCSLPWFTFLDFLNHFKDLITCCPGRPLVLAGNEKVLYK